MKAVTSMHLDVDSAGCKCVVELWLCCLGESEPGWIVAADAVACRV